MSEQFLCSNQVSLLLVTLSSSMLLEGVVSNNVET